MKYQRKLSDEFVFNYILNEQSLQFQCYVVDS